MDRIGPSDTAALIEALRRVSRGAARGGASVAAGSSRAAPDLRAVLAAIVADVDPDNADAMANAQGEVLRAILARDWGTGAESDPAFASMLDAVDSGISGDARLRELFRKAVISLRSA